MLLLCSPQSAMVGAFKRSMEVTRIGAYVGCYVQTSQLQVASWHACCAEHRQACVRIKAAVAGIKQVDVDTFDRQLRFNATPEALTA